MGRSLKVITALVLKDWRLFLADRRAAFLCFAVPIVLASAFGIIFDKPGRQIENCKLPLLVVNEDQSAFGAGVVEDLKQSSHVDVQSVDRGTAEREVARRPCVAVVLPPRSSDKPTVIVLHHPLATMESQWAEGAVTEVVMKRAAKDFLKPLGLGANIERPFAVERQTVNDGHPFNSRSHSFSGMTLQYLLFWGMECGLLMLRERRQGIWRRVCVSPVPLSLVLLARALSTASIAVLQIVVTFGFGYLVFGVTIDGSIVGFVLLAASVSVLAAGVGLLVASVGRTEASARNVLIVAILGMSMLGGLWLPAFLLPKWVQDWSQCLPTTWAMRGLDGVTWQGHGLGSLWPSLLVVNLFAFAFLLAAACRFHLLEARRRRAGVA